MALSFCLLALSGTVFSQTEQETLVFGGEGGGSSETSPFISLLRERQEPIFPEDVMIGALHRDGVYGEDLDLLARKIERFFIGNEGEEILVSPEALRAFRRINASVSRSDRFDRRDVVLRSVRIGRFTVRPSGREASAAIRFICDDFFSPEGEGECTGNLFFEYINEKGWQITGADFNIFRPAERSEDGQYTWKN